MVNEVVLGYVAPADTPENMDAVLLCPGSLEFSGEVQGLCDRAVRGESQNALGWKGPVKVISSNPPQWAGTFSIR